MRKLTRTFALLTGALIFGGVASDAALAGIVSATPSISGAGAVSRQPGPLGIPYPACRQPGPVRESDVLQCRTWSIAPTQNNATPSLTLTAIADPGWKFHHWEDCTGTPDKYARTCTVTAPARSDYGIRPTAHFTDEAPPSTISDLVIRSYPGVEGDYEASWSSTETGMRFLCGIDGRDATDCTPRLRLHFAEGHHILKVVPIDSNGNAAPSTAATISTVDTALPVAPADGAQLQKAVLEAKSRIGQQFECSVDGAPFATCGHVATAGAATPLTLPPLADGRHTVRVRARYGSFVDEYPASRTWTVDRTAPETSLRPTGIGFDLMATESPVAFRCRVDNGPLERCSTPYALPALAPGAHTFEAYATDVAGNTDPTPAKHAWTIVSPTPVPTATPAPSPTATTLESAPVTTAPATIATAPQPLSFQLRYATRNGRVTRFAVAELAPRADLRVSVKCPKRKRCPRGFAKWNALGTVELKRLVGKRLPAGTKITVRARRGQLTATQTITIKKRA